MWHIIRPVVVVSVIVECAEEHDQVHDEGHGDEGNAKQAPLLPAHFSSFQAISVTLLRIRQLLVDSFRRLRHVLSLLLRLIKIH